MPEIGRIASVDAGGDRRSIAPPARPKPSGIILVNLNRDLDIGMLTLDGPGLGSGETKPLHESPADYDLRAWNVSPDRRRFVMILEFEARDRRRRYYS